MYKNSTFCPQSAFVHSVCILELTLIIFLYSMSDGFYNRDRDCLLHSMNWIFKYNSS